jgi:hypothetical protein
MNAIIEQARELSARPNAAAEISQIL